MCSANYLSIPTRSESHTIYIACVDGRVHALDFLTGKEKWNFKTTGFSQDGDLFSSSELSIVPGSDGKIYLNTMNGLTAHSMTAQEIISKSPFSSYEHNVIYLGSKRTSVYALHPEYGLIKSFGETDLNDEFYGLEIVHLSRNDYKIVAVDLVNGNELWNLTGGNFVIENYEKVNHEFNNMTDSDFQYSEQSRESNSEYQYFLVTSSTTGTIQLIDIKTGEPIWKTSLKSPAIEAYIHSQNVIFFTEEQLLTSQNSVFVAVHGKKHYALPSLTSTALSHIQNSYSKIRESDKNVVVGGESWMVNLYKEIFLFIRIFIFPAAIKTSKK